MNAVIEVRALEKRYGRVLALNGLDLDVADGEVHGFLGPNGAGKSTTIRILLGLARATSGRATVFGRDPWTDAKDLHRRIGYVPGDVNLWPNISGGEAIDLISRLRGGAADKAAYAARKRRLVEAFQFDPTKKGRAYSKGNRQKVALIAAFVTRADLLILDEPTSGLDPLMESVFEQEIRRAAGEGTTVLLSSHILSEVEQLCDRVTIIRAGATAETGTLAELRHLTRTEVAFVSGGLTNAQLTSIPDAHDLLVDAGRARFSVDSDRLAPVLSALGALDVQGLTIAPPSLEELFLRHYGEQLDGAGAGAAPTGDASAPAVSPRHAEGANRR
ncbi:ABC transporter ATP-binding protein [Herbiconiux ginsengi]|uniref:ABC-2 type transport system ATP-binding protein n=1 Tax=Herbiconiux ginsengi TaxID=381665 RepID=A0A1H3KHM8_9MICO|nr:ABC transporter ATP-binding protein [Herbiconiux ginsengi]SDY51540.1 ABC-2 type transport system ATP-binding protein [Herbiconiux ginsengi]